LLLVANFPHVFFGLIASGCCFPQGALFFLDKKKEGKSQAKSVGCFFFDSGVDGKC